MATMKLTAREKISKAKAYLFRRKPFFAYIIDRLVVVEDNNVPTMGVDLEGRLLFNAQFVDALPQKEVNGVLMHEGMHTALLHVWRLKGRDMMLWNIATDIVVNRIVIANGESIPNGGLIPNGDEITVGGVTITELDKKCADDVYNILKRELPQPPKPSKRPGRDRGEEGSKGKEKGDPSDGSNGNGDGESDSDSDKPGDGKGGVGQLEPKNHGGWKESQRAGKSGKGGRKEKSKQLSPKELEEQLKKWQKVLESASTYAKMQGLSPLGVDREIENIHQHKVNWRALLRKTVASCIPRDFTWRLPNKKFIWSDQYLPSTEGEKVNVLVSLDTSGSVDTAEMGDYVSEMIGIARSFSQVDFRVLCHDTEPYDMGIIRNGNRRNLLAIKPKGGGGTDHRPLMEYIKAKKYHKDTKLLICFTDGCSSFPEKKPPYNVLIVLCGRFRSDKASMPKWADVIEVV